MPKIIKPTGNRRVRRRTTQRVARGLPTIGVGENATRGFPNQLVTKMRYHSNQLLTSSSGTIGKYVFSCNDIYDPDTTGTGHQPLYHDTFQAIYDHYSVISSTITVTYVNNQSWAAVIGLLIDDDATTSTNVDTLCEQNNGVHHFLPSLTGALSAHTHTFHFDCLKVLGIDPYKTQSYKTAFGASPTEISNYLCWSIPFDGTSSGSLPIDVTIDYLVLCSELKTPTQS